MKYKRTEYLLLSRNGDHYTMQMREYQNSHIVGPKKYAQIVLRFFRGNWYKELSGKKAASLVDHGNGIIVKIRNNEYRMDYAAAEEFLLMMDLYRKKLYQNSLKRFGREPFDRIEVKYDKKAK